MTPHGMVSMDLMLQAIHTCSQLSGMINLLNVLLNMRLICYTSSFYIRSKKNALFPYSSLQPYRTCWPGVCCIMH